MRRFELSEKEEIDWKLWISTHRCEGFIQELDTINAANYAICFIPTSVADCVELRCALCGEKKDITDVSCW